MSAWPEACPTAQDMERVTEWPVDDPFGWIDFVEDLWWSSDALIRHTQRRLYLSTGGWSDNEAIAAAMRGSLLWFFGFVSHRRGGHYVIDLTRLRHLSQVRQEVD